MPAAAALRRVFSFLDRFQVPPGAREGFADPAAHQLTAGLETPPKAALGPVPDSSVPRTGCNRLLAGQPGPERSGSQLISPASLSVCKKTPMIYSRQLSWAEKKTCCSLRLFLILFYFFFITEVANNNTAGTAPSPIAASFLPFSVASASLVSCQADVC